MHATFAKPATAEQIWTDLVAGNQRFRAGTSQPRDLVAEREAVSKGQHPNAIVLTCSDSRVAPEIIFDQGLGNLFVIRTAGNTADALAIGSMEFAAERLDVRVLVVLGHTSCGAVRAACTTAKVASANLSAVLKPILPACQQPGLQGDALLRAVEQANVRRSARDILDSSSSLRGLVEQGRLTVVEAYYRLETGGVERLEPSGLG